MALQDADGPAGCAPGSGDLMLGTAQFGMPYGIRNHVGPPASREVTEIVKVAWERGVRTFDTAPAYGTSEQALGNALSELGLVREARVISKFKASDFAHDPRALHASVEATLSRLRVPRLWGLLLHDEDQLDEWDSLRDAAASLRRLGLCDFIGASVYSPDRALQALEIEGLDIVQVPANVFDRRMHRAGVFARADAAGKKVVCRSVFLQGLCFMAAHEIPPALAAAAPAIDVLRRHCAQNGLDLPKFAIDFVRWMAPGADILIGAESAVQVVEVCAWAAGQVTKRSVHEAWSDKWPADDVAFNDPRRWPVGRPLQ